jgi:hypothetical protein
MSRDKAPTHMKEAFVAGSQLAGGSPLFEYPILLPPQGDRLGESHRLMAEVVDEVEDQGKNHTQQHAGYQGKIEGEILAAIIDIARKVAKRQMGSPQRNKDQTSNAQNRPKHNHQLPKISHDSSFRRSAAPIGLIEPDRDLARDITHA